MDRLPLHSPDLTAENIEKLASLFPNCVVEAKDADGKLTRKIDFDQLRQELSDKIVEGPTERYRLDWPGKREALLTANAPIAKTLRPCREESVNFDTTQNLYIEGDNLDALKLLQETYLGKVKMIYIDPPYNTGNDFIYDDDFADNLVSYLKRSSQTDDSGVKRVANTEANGRFHSDWLSMIYSRLKVAKNFLSNDGLVMISIDDNELPNLRRVADEVFGEDSFLTTFVWQRRKMADSRNEDRASTDHEYVVCYKQSDARLKGNPIDREKYTNPDNDPRGPWFSADLTGIANRDERPNLHYDVVNPKTGDKYPPSPTRGWSCAPTTMERLIAENRVIWPQKPDGRPRHKKFLLEATRLETGFSSWLDDVGQTTEGTRIIQDLFGEKVFPFSKPLSLLRKLIEQSTPEKTGIIFDFFAGSATTAHAVLSQNLIDGGTRRFILVQLPEATGRKDFSTISEIAKERIRRVGANLIEENATTSPNFDIGFRVLKIDTSNAKDIYYVPDKARQDELALAVDNIKEDRTPEDLLFQVMLDWGIDLSLPITREKINGKQTFFVDQNAIAACFDANINEDFVKELAKRKPLRAVFRDNGFASDAVKINVEQVFKLLSPTTDLKSI
jgi:adenine-specific DNA-methyltransferase